MSGQDPRTERLLDAVGTDQLTAGQAFELWVYTASQLTEAQLERFKSWLADAAGINVTAVQQFDQRVSDARADRRGEGPAEIGDNAIAIAGVPSVGMGAAAAIGWVLRGLAWVGAAAAAWTFTQNPAGVGSGVAEAAQAAKWPLLLILLIILALLYAWKKL
jgi:hypothetical protein